MTSTPPLAAEIHAAMCAFTLESRRRRRVVPVLHVGRPDGEQRTVAEVPWLDAGARADLVTRALDGLTSPESARVWLCRSAPLATAPVDLAWLSAARTAHARHGLDLTHFFVVTREGWAELLSGEEHRWHRVRPERHVS